VSNKASNNGRAFERINYASFNFSLVSGADPRTIPTQPIVVNHM